MSNKPRVGVFFGSRTPEHDVSIISAQLVIKGLESSGYEVVPIYIGTDGHWYIANELGDISFFKNKDYKETLKKYGGWQLQLKTEKTMVFRKEGLFGKSVEIDIAFPVLHGEFGEDGTIQGLFEMVGVPYVGCGVLASAVAMDKELTKEFYTAQKIETAPYITIQHTAWGGYKEQYLRHIKEIGLPVFVKPARGGSSIGITRVEKEEDLETAIEVAFHYDTKVLVERAIPNLVDLTCAVRDTAIEPEASLVQQSLFSEGMFSYDDKYIKEGGAQTGKNNNGFVIPADIKDDVTKKVQDISKEIFQYLGCAGMARVDFLYDKGADKLYANEINTIPGTLYHHLWKEGGISLTTLLNDLIENAFRLHKEKSRITRTFKSSILSSANENKLATKLQNNE